jgi:hypothetical protein
MLRCTAIVSAICTFAFSAAADSGVAALAAPGDCAQPSADYETPPLYEQPAGVSGSAADHFAPRVNDGIGSGLTGVVSGAGNAIGAEGLGAVAGSTTDALGGGGLTGSALGTATGTVDALTDTATGATSNLLGGRK